MADEMNIQPEEESQSTGPLAQLWNSLRPPVRIGILALGTLALLLIVIISVNRATPSQMEVLFQRLDPVQARDVAARLDEMGVVYELAEDGTTILVAADQKDRLRLTLSPDLYSQGIGFALFENGGLVASDFERRVQWQIALEEELRRTITSIDAVESARVHLVITEEGLFIRERKDPSASVFLKLSPLASLNETQVRGILSLVAGSVEGLKPENVTIVDSRGNILYDAFAALDEMSVSTAVEGHLRLKRLFETELERRLRSILEQVYGPGSAVAMVSADLDFNTMERTVVTFEDDPVTRSTHRIEERSENIAAAGEEVGEPNVPGQAAVIGGGGGDSLYERTEEIVNYEVSETREYIAAAPGQVVRLSTAVIIDSDGNDPFLEEQVIDLVNSAIGLDEARGDTVSVQLLPFDTDWVVDPSEGIDAPEITAFPLLYAILAGVLVLIIMLILFSVMRKRAQRLEEDIDLEDYSLEEQLQAKIIEDLEPSEAENKAQQIRKMAKEEPESVADLLKTWLAEE
jgi:flagellar M-ring protein FliF